MLNGNVHCGDPMNTFYKYKPFNTHTLETLAGSQLYYANPSELNDPLDCRPTVKQDIELKNLHQLCGQIITKTKDEKTANDKIAHWQYMSTQYGGLKTDQDARDAYAQYLVHEIQSQLDNLFRGQGVLSLAKNWNCPLMWSHYADQHQGLCIGYEVDRDQQDKIQPINYVQDRRIATSAIEKWIMKDCKIAKKQVSETYFYCKASHWEYEKEYRDVAKRPGLQNNLFSIENIYFGMRCPDSVIACVVKLFDGSRIQPDFYEVYPSDPAFGLERRIINTDEVLMNFPRRPAWKDFKIMEDL